MKRCEVHSIQDIDVILDYVHDRRFDTDRIVFDQEKHCLTIPTTILGKEQLAGKYLFLKRWQRDVYAADLLIHNAFDYELIDQAKVGCGDIANITLDGNTVVIKGGLPVTIRVRVSKLHLELVVTDRIIRQERYLLFCMRDYIDRNE